MNHLEKREFIRLAVISRWELIRIIWIWNKRILLIKQILECVIL